MKKTQLKEKLEQAKPKGVSDEYTEGIGRRKTSVARVRLFESDKNLYVVNGDSLEAYFPTAELRYVIEDPFKKAETDKKFFVSAKVSGGGKSSQAEAVRHGISRALVGLDPDLRTTLKRAGFLKRDDRQVERKKFGLKKARKAAQWSKR